jgi:hypothetical protein
MEKLEKIRKMKEYNFQFKAKEIQQEIERVNIIMLKRLDEIARNGPKSNRSVRSVASDIL